MQATLTPVFGAHYEVSRSSFDITKLFYAAGESLCSDLGIDAQYSGSSVTSDLQEQLDYAIPALVGHGTFFADAAYIFED